MCHLLNGPGAVRTHLPHHGRVCHRGLLGRGHHRPRPHCKVCPELEVHPIGHQCTNPGDNILYLVKSLLRFYNLLFYGNIYLLFSIICLDTGNFMGGKNRD